MVIDFYNFEVWYKVRFNFGFGDISRIVVFVVN